MSFMRVTRSYASSISPASPQLTSTELTESDGDMEEEDAMVSADFGYADEVEKDESMPPISLEFPGFALKTW